MSPSAMPRFRTQISARLLLSAPITWAALIGGCVGTSESVTVDCRLNSDCPENAVCSAGECVVQCREDRDCEQGLVCTPNGCELLPDVSGSDAQVSEDTTSIPADAEVPDAVAPDVVAPDAEGIDTATEPDTTSQDAAADTAPQADSLDCTAVVGATCVGNTLVEVLACEAQGEVLEECTEFEQCTDGGCIRVECAPPPPIQNAVPISGTFSAGDTVQYVCEAGFELQGDPSLQCDRNGEWPTSDAICAALEPLFGNACAANSDCVEGGWCPTDTTERRCAPRLALGASLMEFQFIPGGNFMMGSPESEVGRYTWEAQVEVTLSRNYLVQRTEVTQAQWRAVSGGTNPACFQSAGADVFACTSDNLHPDHPVEQVNWWSAVAFANAVSELEGLTPCYVLPTSGCTGRWQDGTLQCGSGAAVTLTADSVYECVGYRLPTEAEWERATRAGTTSATFLGNLVGEVNTCSTPPQPIQPSVDPIAWYCRNSNQASQMVAQKQPNPWGLFDMAGNVSEWVWDRYASSMLGGIDPVVETGRFAIARGGSWIESPNRTRAAYRETLGAETSLSVYGLRLARTSL
jgi:formylglycine-generating enzyme required for sulfatase activity